MGCMGPNVTSILEPEMAAGPSRISALSSRYIRFGPFQVDQHRQEVSKNGSRLKLQGKVYQVLLALIEKQGEVVTGLLYVSPDSQDLHDTNKTVKRPLVDIPHAELVPGAAALKKLQERFR